MKFEMVSGDEKLFDGAPGWALFVSRNASGNLYFEEHSEIKEGGRTMGVVSRLEDSYIEDAHKLYIIAERRPITESNVNEWNGEGLPPVGVECEVIINALRPSEWTKCTIVFSEESTGAAFVYADRGGLNCVGAIGRSDLFRPARSNKEIARDNAIGALEKAWEQVTEKPAFKFEAIYDAIAAGKIPGIKLE